MVNYFYRLIQNGELSKEQTTELNVFLFFLFLLTFVLLTSTIVKFYKPKTQKYFIVDFVVEIDHVFIN